MHRTAGAAEVRRFVQTGKPATKPGQIARVTPAIRSLATQTDVELAQIADKAPESPSNPVALADSLATQEGKSAHSEMFRRATNAATGQRVR
jgi:hypothetical protein